MLNKTNASVLKFSDNSKSVHINDVKITEKLSAENIVIVNFQERYDRIASFNIVDQFLCD